MDRSFGTLLLLHYNVAPGHAFINISVCVYLEHSNPTCFLRPKCIVQYVSITDYICLLFESVLMCGDESFILRRHFTFFSGFWCMSIEWLLFCRWSGWCTGLCLPFSPLQKLSQTLCFLGEFLSGTLWGFCFFFLLLLCLYFGFLPFFKKREVLGC